MSKKPFSEPTLSPRTGMWTKEQLERMEKEARDRLYFCNQCNEDTKRVSAPGHSIGMIHALCIKCGMCNDCDEGNV